MHQPFVGRGWIPCRVIQYPKYSILNLAKCVFICDFVLAMPIHFCCGFVQRACACAYHFLSVCLYTNSGLCSLTKFAVLSVHPLSPTSLIYARTYSKSEKILKDVGTITKTHWKTLIFVLAPRGDNST